MGIRSGFGVGKRTTFATIANLGVIIKRAVGVLLPTSRESISSDMLASNCLPYQASKTYRVIMTEANCQRAQMMVEVQRSLRPV